MKCDSVWPLSEGEEIRNSDRKGHKGSDEDGCRVHRCVTYLIVCLGCQYQPFNSTE